MNIYKHYRHYFLLLCLSLAILPGVKASNERQEATDYAAIDRYISEEMEDLGIPGMALGIIEEGRVTHLKGFGTADSSGRAVSPQTPFHIGSVTKSFTALAVMQLVEEGKIDLDEPLQTYLPWFTLADQEAAAQMTMRHLLNHTSGISTHDGNKAFSSQEDLQRRVRDLGSLKLVGPVGESYHYSNLNYDIAGLIIETASGQSYADYVSQHLFQPLDMGHSYASESEAQADGLAAGHLYVLGQALQVPRETPPSHLPSGYLMASVEDLSHYALSHLNDGRFGEVQILSPQGMAELHRPAVVAGAQDRQYAMGWAVGPLEGIQTIRHDGSDGRNYAVIILMPESKSGIIMLANAIGFYQSWQGGEIAQNVLRSLQGQPINHVSYPAGPTFLYWAIMLTPLLMILGIILIWRRGRDKGWAYVLPIALLYISIPIFWLIVVPRLVQAPIWYEMRVNISQPELATAMLLSALLGIGWSAFYLGSTFKMQKRAVQAE